MLYKGKPIEQMTKEELIEALKVMQAYYEDRINGLKEMAKYA